MAHDDQGFCLFTKRLTDGCFDLANHQGAGHRVAHQGAAFAAFGRDRLAPAEQDLSTAFGWLILMASFRKSRTPTAGARDL
ncbi:hypothetical protein NKH49_25660 [Mesorhizobium sp. M1088]